MNDFDSKVNPREESKGTEQVISTHKTAQLYAQKTSMHSVKFEGDAENVQDSLNSIQEQSVESETSEEPLFGYEAKISSENLTGCWRKMKDLLRN